MTTLYASSASASAAYYTQYLTQAVGEEPGGWRGVQAGQLGLTGDVAADALQALFEGRDPTTGTPLGQALVDRYRTDGTLVRAVAGFDATFSAPKSVSVLWALTGDPAVLEVHDQAVNAALAHLERFGATTRVRVNGARQFPDTAGLVMATFRQSTSRADDPQLHTHAVISTKVQTADGRWWALDARYLKRHQRMLGGLYQSALRAGMAERFGVAWQPIVNGQADIAGVPDELLSVLSKRTVQVDAALVEKVREFRSRAGRDPSRWERAALTREAAVDTRAHKTGTGVTDLMTRWRTEAAQLGWTPDLLHDAIRDAARDITSPAAMTVADVLDRLSTNGSTWPRADLVRAICDVAPAGAVSAQRWAAVVERAADQVVDGCVNLDPTDTTTRRREGDGRSVWIEPVATQYTSDAILAEEERVLSWAWDRQAADPTPSPTVTVNGLDVVQAAAACAAAGRDPLVLIEGPAGTGKTTMLLAAADDLTRDGRPVFGVAPTAKAARVLETETRIPSDTIAKLLHEHARTDRAALDRYRLPAGTTLVVDEASMIGTPTLHRLARLADQHRWRVVLVGDPRQLQAVGRGGLFAEVCVTGRVHALATVHRFANEWEAAASLRLRHGDTSVFDTYDTHGRITPGSLDTHLEHLAHQWIVHNRAGRTVAITATTNAEVDAINEAIHTTRLLTGDLEHTRGVALADHATAHPGTVVVTRRNDRTLTTTTGDTVRNRDRWTVTHTHPDASLTVTPIRGHGTVRLPADYVREHVQLGYAATEHGNQGITVDVAYQLVSAVTTNRGLYVGATRGRDHNQFLAMTDTNDPAEARDLLDRVLTFDRADIPAVVQRRHLHTAQAPAPRPEPAPAWVHGVDWLGPWRDALVAKRVEVLGQCERHERERLQAVAELNELQPVITAGLEAWQPYQTRIDTLDEKLRTELQPAMWTANNRAPHATFGHRHSLQRAAKHANQAVADARAEIAAVRDSGRDAKARADELNELGGHLRQLTAPSALARIGQQLLGTIDRNVAAIDTWAAWNGGQTVNVDNLIAALHILDRSVRDAPVDAAGRVIRADVRQLTESLAEWLTDRGYLAAALTIERQPERDRGFGVEL